MSEAPNDRPAHRLLKNVRRPFFLALNLLLFVHVVAPLVPGGPAQGSAVALGGAILWIGLSGGLIVATYACGSHRRIRNAVLPLTAVLTITGIIFGDEASTVTTVQRILFAALVTISTLLILEYVIRARRVNADTIFASMCAYFLLAVLWSFLYAAIESTLAANGVVAFDPSPGGSGQSIFQDLYYFSFVTLTTLGYGDMSPVHPVARAFATLEAFTGQMFVTVLIARLVALQIMGRRDIRRPE